MNFRYWSGMAIPNRSHNNRTVIVVLVEFVTPVELHEPLASRNPGGAEPNLLILWRRGCINSKIDLKNIGPCAADASLCAKTFGG